MTNLDYLYNPDAAKPFFENDYFVDKKLGFRVIENGMILPYRKTGDDGKAKSVGFGDIVDSKGEFIKESYVLLGLGGKYTTPPESIQYSSETIIYLGVSLYVWGHCLTDNIRRIWFLRSEFFKSEFKNCPLVYIPRGEHTIENLKNFKRLLELSGVRTESVHPITQPTKFNKIILPDESFFRENGLKFTKEYHETIEMVRNFAIKNRTPTSSKKIYYFHGIRQMGEKRLAEYFKSKGYEIIRPDCVSDFV